MRSFLCSLCLVAFALVALTNVACDDHKSPVQKIVKSIQPVVATPVPQADVLQDQSCEAYLQALSIVTLKSTQIGQVKIEINTNKIYDEGSLIKWLEEFAVEFFTRQPCATNEVLIATLIDDENIFSGSLRRGDFELHRDLKITTAEWVRRFEVTRVETVTLLKSLLHKARDSGANDEALKILDRISEKDSVNPLWYVIKGNVLLDKEAIFDAIAMYESALALAPHDALALFNLAFAYRQVGSFSKSLELYQKLSDLKLRADDEFYLHWADSYLRNNQPADALALLNNIKDKSSSSFVLIQAGALRLLKNYEEAKVVLEGGLKLGADEDLMTFDLVLVNLDRQNLDDAKFSYTRLKELDMGLAKELSFLATLPSGGVNVMTDTEDNLATSTATETSDENEGQKF